MKVSGRVGTQEGRRALSGTSLYRCRIKNETMSFWSGFF